jgi:hypothetical protein
LYSELQESDSHAAPLVRFLFLAAFQPYMQHMRSWMYSTASVAPHFGTAEGDSAGVGPQMLNNNVSGRFNLFLLVPFLRLTLHFVTVCCFCFSALFAMFF